jgi:Activator of Hsp90 ATPase homolog 1-like protein
MSELASVQVTIHVEVDPATAFRVFTEDFDDWYRSGSVALGPHARRGGPLHLEPHEGGRLLESRPSGAEVERARITVWEPGAHLVFVDRRTTEVDVRFTPEDGGTRVVLVHSGLDRLPPGHAADIAKYGWSRLATWFENHLHEGNHR